MVSQQEMKAELERRSQLSLADHRKRFLVAALWAMLPIALAALALIRSVSFHANWFRWMEEKIVLVASLISALFCLVLAYVRYRDLSWATKRNRI